MANTDLLEEIEKDFDILGDAERSPDLSLSGAGDEFSDPFEVPGGLAIFDMDFKNSGRYVVKAVGQTAEDETVRKVYEAPIQHRVVTILDEGTFILNVDAEDGAEWDVDLYFSSPEVSTLPVNKSGRGNDFIGPIGHEGFINISVTNYDTSRLRIDLPRSTGKIYAGSPGFKLDGTKDKHANSKEEITSTQDGRTNHPWVYIQSRGEWEIEVVIP